RVLPLLAARGFRAVAMDTPGFGLSDPPPGPPQDMTWYSSAAVGLLDSLGIRRTHLVGLRTGASIAVDLAAVHPERVSRVVLTGLFALDSDEARQHWLTDGPVQRWELDGRGEFLQSHLLDWLRHFTKETDAEQFLQELIAALQAGPNYWWAYESVVRFD